MNRNTSQVNLKYWINFHSQKSILLQTPLYVFWSSFNWMKLQIEWQTEILFRFFSSFWDFLQFHLDFRFFFCGVVVVSDIILTMPKLQQSNSNCCRLPGWQTIKYVAARIEIIFIYMERKDILIEFWFSCQTLISFLVIVIWRTKPKA